ncbi:DUF3570 domain-containing protein [Vibrio algarum]|uniref:DUF3570 domain-containing protein n=1 Tax=Vibrio algarum TaxID=3020714 RepID=A0ABT4YW64_9VIBR|nr:DUF3570 domain-containing protein [Vibrio sp. KJ40-1]MDB1125828.1 DUF3570 domain-containing protein [Vibrio sp. KJ40-1]
MQLTNIGKISSALAVASQLLISPNAQADESNSDAMWDFDSAFLYYGEDSDRVMASEGMFAAKRTNGDGQVFSSKLTIDALTGASPTGAVAQNEAQTFTRPSGDGSYVVAPGDTPLDDTFHDTRVQLNLGWSSPINRVWDWSTGLHLSKEYDYLSLGGNLGFTRALNQNNTEFSMGIGGYFDTIEPEGGVPVGGSEMVYRNDYSSDAEFNAAFENTRRDSSETKATTELNFGVSQVINRWLITSFNYNYSLVSGYLTDPFKLMSVVDDSGTTQQILYENRPDSRTKHVLFWQTKANISGQVLDVSYRYMLDDWEMDSHTIDLRYNYTFSNNHYFEPHIRFYTQSEADFYSPYLMESSQVPEFMSADYRLGKMNTYTLGFKYGLPINDDELAFRLEYYVQQPKNAGFDEPGQLAQQDLYPEISAIIAQVNYSF